ncbi:hypothetical protein, partial [Pokkaliibacter plantistimulans]|uniref:hypothetical protein n=1 Tax=Pokkaliibacter plantistimulans TaxID=1635171 RepID=UPI002D78C202
TASTVESGQTFTDLTLTVTNVTNGSSELLGIDGSSLSLTDGNSGSTTSHGLNYNVTVSGTTATLTLSGGSLSATELQTLITGLTYQNTSDDPAAASRAVTLTSVTDNGGTANGGSDSTSLTLTSTVAMTPVNDAPTLTATAANPTFVENGSAVSLFSGTSASAIESGQTFTGLTLTVTNVTNGSSELLGIDGSSLSLTEGNSGTTTSHDLNYSVTVSGTTATLTLSGGSLSAAELQTLINGLSYQNTSDDPGSVTRTVTLTSVTDNGGTANGGSDTGSLALISTVSITALNDSPVLTDSNLALDNIDEDAGAPVGAVGTLVSDLVSNSNVSDLDGDGLGIAVVGVNSHGTLYYSLDGGSTWTAASGITENSALVLYADSSTRIYFQADADFNGPLSDAMTIKAWDRTGGYDNGDTDVNASSDLDTDRVATFGVEFINTRQTVVVGNYLYIADSDNGFHIVDVTDPANPVLLSTYDTPDEPRGVVIVGNVAYIADEDSGLQIIDISDPTQPTLLGSIGRDNGYSFGIAVEGNYAYIASAYGGLHVIDVSDPTQPVLVGQLDYPSSGDAMRVVVEGNYAYIADTAGGVQIIDITDPTQPSLTANFATSSYAYDLSLSGSTLYVATTSALVVLDVSDPGNPTQLGSYATGGETRGVTVDGNYAYVTDSRTVVMLDVSDPSNPTLVTTLTTGYISNNVTFSDGILYVGMSQVGGAIDIFGISTPSSAFSADTDTVSLTVNPVNDAPLVSLSSGTASFVENTSAVAIDAGLTLSDVDNSTLAAATLAITGNFASGEDVLAFTNTDSNTFGNISGSYNSTTGVLTLTSSGATATLAQWQAALRAATYDNSSDNPSTTTRNLTITINDGSDDSVAATRDITVSAANDAPTAGVISTQNATEDSAFSFTVPTGTFADVDAGDSLTYTATLADGSALP